MIRHEGTSYRLLLKVRILLGMLLLDRLLSVPRCKKRTSLVGLLASRRMLHAKKKKKEKRSLVTQESLQPPVVFNATSRWRVL